MIKLFYLFIIGLLVVSPIVFGLSVGDSSNMYYVFGDDTVTPVLVFNQSGDDGMIWVNDTGLYVQNSTGYWFNLSENCSVSGGSHSLNDLTDVLLVGVADNEHLIYDAGSGKWKNEVFVGGADGYAGDQAHPHVGNDLNVTSSPTFVNLICQKVNTGNGLYELYAMNQDVESTDAVTFATVNTGNGASEVYPDDHTELIDMYDTIGLKDLSVNEVNQLENIGDITAISAQNWAYLALMDQALSTVDSVTFKDITSTDYTGDLYNYMNAYDTGSWSRLYINANFVPTIWWQVQNVTKWRMQWKGSTSDYGMYDDISDEWVMVYDTSDNEWEFSNYVGIGDTAVTRRLQLPNTAGNDGYAEFNAHGDYCDSRFKSWYSDLPKEKVLNLCRMVRPAIYRYIDTGQDDNGTIWFGDVTNHYFISVIAQDLYYNIKNEFGLKVANGIINKPVDESVEYWGLRTDQITMLFMEAWNINDERITLLEEEVFG